MSVGDHSIIPEILRNYQTELLNDWLSQQIEAGILKNSFKERELREECRDFLDLLSRAVQSGHLTNVRASEWTDVREMLTSFSRTSSQKGFTSTETASFVFSLKQPLFNRLRQEIPQDNATLTQEICVGTTLLDNLGLWTIESYQKAREAVILRQQEELMELSTPVVKLWEGILALPVIGTLDSTRTQVMMESLLQKIVETGSDVAIIDITGVPTVDTLTAQHLLKTVTAARLMGADCIISGIRPQIAQTIVYLGVDLADVITKATLADAFALAIKRSGFTINRSQAQI